MKYLQQQRGGTGGLLLMASSIILTIALCFTTALCRVASARDITENVENTIASQCLSSCYLYKEGEFTSTNPTDTTFKKVNKSNASSDFSAEELANNILNQYGFVANGERVQVAYMSYESKSKGTPTFTIQLKPFKIADIKVLGIDMSTIAPEPASVSVEKS